MHIYLQGWLEHTETSPKSSLVYHHNTNDSRRGLGADFNNRREMRNTLWRKQRTTTIKKRNSTWHPLAIRAELQHTPLKLRAQIAQQLRAFLRELSNEPYLFQLFPNFDEILQLMRTQDVVLGGVNKTTESAFFFFLMQVRQVTRKARRKFSRVRVVYFTARSSRELNKNICSAVSKSRLKPNVAKREATSFALKIF